MRPPSILLVDRDAAVRTLVGRILARHRFEIIEFADSASAMRALPSIGDDLSAVVSGKDMAALVRARIPGIPILTMPSGDGFDSRTLIRALRGLTTVIGQLVIAAPAAS